MCHIHSSENEELVQQTESLAEKIQSFISKMPIQGVTLIEILNIVGDDSLMLITIFLSLVFLVPVSIPGVSTVFGSAILLIAISRLFSRQLWLPGRIANRIVSTEKLTATLNRALVWFKRLEKISRPHRFSWATTNGLTGLINKFSFILGALLLMVPFSFIPFSNTLPALALIFLALGVIQKDGVCILLGHVSNLATIIYFAALVSGGGITIHEIIRLITG